MKILLLGSKLASKVPMGDWPESPQINRCVDSATAKPSWFATGVKVRPRMVRRHASGLNLIE
jgi:hypothetical protein